MASITTPNVVASVPSLTTVFSPPADCLSTAYRSVEQGKSYIQLGPHPTNAPSCYPPQYSLATEFYYSPARNCPAGWTIAASTKITTFGSVTETRATCCPTSGFVIQTDKSSRPNYSTMGCTITAPDYTTSLLAQPDGKTVSVGSGFNAYSIEIRYRSDDAKFFSQPTITSTSTPAPSNSSPDPAQSSGLSTGAKAGIGIGAAVCALSVAGFLLFVYRFKRRKGATKKLPPLPLYGLVKSELSANSERREVSADQLPQELEAAHMRPELPGDRGRNG